MLRLDKQRHKCSRSVHNSLSMGNHCPQRHGRRNAFTGVGTSTDNRMTIGCVDQVWSLDIVVASNAMTPSYHQSRIVSLVVGKCCQRWATMHNTIKTIGFPDNDCTTAPEFDRIKRQETHLYMKNTRPCSRVFSGRLSDLAPANITTTTANVAMAIDLIISFPRP